MIRTGWITASWSRYFLIVTAGNRGASRLTLLLVPAVQPPDSSGTIRLEEHPAAVLTGLGQGRHVHAYLHRPAPDMVVLEFEPWRDSGPPASVRPPARFRCVSHSRMQQADLLSSLAGLFTRLEQTVGGNDAATICAEVRLLPVSPAFLGVTDSLASISAG